MKAVLRKMAGAVMAVMLMVTPVVLTMSASEPAWAACDPETKKDEKGEECTPREAKPPETSILPNDMDIQGILDLLLKILVYGLGAAATLGVVIAGIMYLTARDNEQQVATAKKRLYEVVIGLVAWAVMFTVLNWLIPGGLSLNL